jgi:hypothetical protein
LEALAVWRRSARMRRAASNVLGESVMLRGLAISVVVLVGCGPTAQEEYDTSLRVLNRQQERLDALRPAYDAARQTATLTVCKEIAGFTPDESATAALEQLGGILGGAADGAPAENSTTETKDVGDIDRTIDNLLAAQENLANQQAALSGPVQKVNDVMNKIKTPGTPEAKRFEEVLAQMPEAQAYTRQEQRVKRAQEAADEAEATLADDAAK